MPGFSSLIPNRRILLPLWMGIITITVLLKMVHVSVSYAIGPSPFSIEPTFFGPYAAAPRAYFTYASTPGAHVYDSIHVTNSGLVRGTIDLYVVDAITGQTSGTSIRPRNDPQTDVGAWISLSRQQVTLGPGQSQEIPFTLTIPSHVRPGQHGGVIVAEDMQQEHFTQSTHERDAQIGIQSFIGLGVLVNLPGPTIERLNATGIHYDENSTHQRLLITLENTGTQLLHPSGNLLLKDDQGLPLQNLPITMDTFLPQNSIDYPVYIQYKALALGRNYTAMLHLIYGHHHILNYTTNFYVPVPQKGPLTNILQRLITPPSGSIFSILTFWDYVIGFSVLFFILSASFFWSQKIHKFIKKVLHRN